MSGGYCYQHGAYTPTTAGYCPQCGSQAVYVGGAAPAAGGTRGEDAPTLAAARSVVWQMLLTAEVPTEVWEAALDDLVRAALAEAEARGRRHGLEEAATLAEETLYQGVSEGGTIPLVGVNVKIAKYTDALRALAGGGGTEEGGT